MNRIFTGLSILIAASYLTACGGSGTPLPSNGQAASLAFTAISTAVPFNIQSFRVEKLILPVGVSIPTNNNGIVIEASNSATPGSSVTPTIVMGSFRTYSSPKYGGVITFSAPVFSAPAGRLKFGRIAQMNLSLIDTALTTSNFTSVNATPLLMQAYGAFPNGDSAGPIDIPYTLTLTK